MAWEAGPKEFLLKTQNLTNLFFLILPLQSVPGALLGGGGDELRVRQAEKQAEEEKALLFLKHQL